jgi:hypothetical protein
VCVGAKALADARAGPDLDAAAAEHPLHAAPASRPARPPLRPAGR